MSACLFCSLSLGGSCILPVCFESPFKHPLSNIFSVGLFIKKKKNLGIVLRVFSKRAGVGLAIEPEMLALLECSLQAKALGLSSLNVEGDSANVIP